MVGALVVAAVTAVGLFDAPTGAQEAGPVVVPIPVEGSVRNAEQRISDDGDVVVFESTSVLESGDEFTRVLVHDRSAGTTWPVPESRGAPGAATEGAVTTS